MRGLLHRIASKNPNARGKMIESVLENLHAILNTERGGGLSTPDLGLDLQQLLVRWPASRQTVLEQIRQLVTRYEHRLHNVEVVFLKEEAPNRIAVLIQADLAGSAFRARTELASPGGISIRRPEADEDE
jgi:type VI secretion system lysozyme-like protein